MLTMDDGGLADRKMGIKWPSTCAVRSQWFKGAVDGVIFNIDELGIWKKTEYSYNNNNIV